MINYSKPMALSLVRMHGGLYRRVYQAPNRDFSFNIAVTILRVNEGANANIF